MKKKILIIGGSEGLGKICVDKFLEFDDVEVTVYDRFFNKEPDERVNNLMADCRDPQALDKAVKVHDIVLHCVETMDGFEEAEILDVNILGLTYLLKVVNKYKRKCFIVRGELREEPLGQMVRKMTSLAYDYFMNKFHFEVSLVEFKNDVEVQTQEFIKNLCESFKE